MYVRVSNVPFVLVAYDPKGFQKASRRVLELPSGLRCPFLRRVLVSLIPESETGLSKRVQSTHSRL